MANKLQVYNNALLHCGERALGSPTENREPRRLLDAVWDGGGVRTCLEAGHWNFGTRTTKIEYDPSIDPEYGFTRAFAKPSDWCRTTTVATDEYLYNALLAHEFADEAGYWFADVEPLYVKFVSDHADFGGDLSLWPESFTRYVEAYFAQRISRKITRSQKLREAIDDEVERLLKGATAKDAMNEGTSVPREGTWNRARHGGSRSGGFRDGGSRSRLIG